MLQDPLTPASPPPLTVMDLFEESVIRGPFPHAFSWLLRGAEELVQALPADYRVEPELGPIRALKHYTALAWVITHYTDMHYRDALGCAPPVAPEQRHPMDVFTHDLGLHLDQLRADGRAANYLVHGWQGDKGGDIDPGWFAPGHLRSFDALGNAIVFADGRRTGIEGRWVVAQREQNDGDGVDDDDDDDSGETAGPPPTDAVVWMRTAEAEAWLAKPRRLLKKKATIEACQDALGVTRLVAQQAFEDVVPADRRRTRGGQHKG